jgi:hypothetical protein
VENDSGRKGDEEIHEMRANLGPHLILKTYENHFVKLARDFCGLV